MLERVFEFRRLRALVARCAKRETQLLDLLILAETSDAAAFFAYLQFQALPFPGAHLESVCQGRAVGAEVGVPSVRQLAFYYQ
jgi:uncharacterized membrane protein